MKPLTNEQSELLLKLIHDKATDYDARNYGLPLDFDDKNRWEDGMTELINKFLEQVELDNKMNDLLSFIGEWGGQSDLDQVRYWVSKFLNSQD